MERLGEALLHMNPDMMGKEMLHILQRYARADKFALDLNWRLGWVPPEGAFCGEHQKQIDHLEAIEAEASIKYETTLKELQKEHSSLCPRVPKTSPISSKMAHSLAAPSLARSASFFREGAHLGASVMAPTDHPAAHRKRHRFRAVGVLWAGPNT